MTETLHGGCLCGRTRYRARGPAQWAGYCHCRICQRSAGAPVLAFALFPAEGFAWEGEAPRRFASSDHGTRLFCGECGTQLAYLEASDPGSVSINTATLDAPEAAPPAMHIWTRSRIAWFELDDDLPRFEASQPMPGVEA